MMDRGKGRMDFGVGRHQCELKGQRTFTEVYVRSGVHFDQGKPLRQKTRLSVSTLEERHLEVLQNKSWR